jgi:prophage maintenance system killer protein
LRSPKDIRSLTATSALPTLRWATFLLLNGADIDATVDEQERLMLNIASGRMSRPELVEWLREHVTQPPDQAV